MGGSFRRRLGSRRVRTPVRVILGLAGTIAGIAAVARGMAEVITQPDVALGHRACSGRRRGPGDSRPGALSRDVGGSQVARPGQPPRRPLGSAWSPRPGGLVASRGTPRWKARAARV